MLLPALLAALLDAVRTRAMRRVAPASRFSRVASEVLFRRSLIGLLVVFLCDFDRLCQVLRLWPRLSATYIEAYPHMLTSLQFDVSRYGFRQVGRIRRINFIRYRVHGVAMRRCRLCSAIRSGRWSPYRTTKSPCRSSRAMTVPSMMISSGLLSCTHHTSMSVSSVAAIPQVMSSSFR